MSFLQQFLEYESICIQCHNNPDPDTLAAALGVYIYLTEHGVQTQIIYGGAERVKKKNLKYMIKECEIPVTYVTELPKTQLLLLVDCQYGQGNVQQFFAPEVAQIDHHPKRQNTIKKELVDTSYQSCSTIIWELLEQEGYPVIENQKLCVALLYGLYTDTASYSDLYKKHDMAMREALGEEYAQLEWLKKSCMTVAELMIAGDALHNFYFDMEKRFVVIPAIYCQQAILGIIGDMAIQVDIARISVAYTDAGNGYQLSIRSCDRAVPANDLMEYICENIGSGGGHIDKAGGRISHENLQKLYGDREVKEVIIERVCEFL